MLFYIKRKWLLMRNLATILLLMSKFSGKNQRFTAIDRSVEMLKNRWISKNVIQLINLSTPPSTYPPPDKILLRLWNKNFLAEIYRNIQTFAFKVLQEYDAWASKNGAVQMLFLTPNTNIFSGKFVKSKRVLAVLREHIVFDVK